MTTSSTCDVLEKPDESFKSKFNVRESAVWELSLLVIYSLLNQETVFLGWSKTSGGSMFYPSTRSGLDTCVLILLSKVSANFIPIIV